MDYKCGNCGKNVDYAGGVVGIQCKECGYKIFFKKRPNKKKVIRPA